MRRIAVLVFFCMAFTNNSNVLNIKKSVAAKVLDTVIMKKDVEKTMDKYSISYNEALNQMVEYKVLSHAALINIEPPDDDSIEDAIKSDKNYYASHFRLNPQDVTDSEFLNAADIGYRSMSEYKAYVKERLHVSLFLNSLYSNTEISSYQISEKDITEFINANPAKFIIPESYEIMLIHFSYFDKDGIIIGDDEIKKKVAKAAECLDKLSQSLSFSDAARAYSDDRLSLAAVPSGYFGKIDKNDSFLSKRFSPEIFKAFSTEPIGVIPRIYGSENGLYIFKLLSRDVEQKIIGKDAYGLAESFIINEKRENLRKKIKKETVEKYKKLFNVIQY